MIFRVLAHSLLLSVASCEIGLVLVHLDAFGQYGIHISVKMHKRKGGSLAQDFMLIKPNLKCEYTLKDIMLSHKPNNCDLTVCDVIRMKWRCLT